MPYNFIPGNLSALEFLQRQVIPRIAPNGGIDLSAETKEYFGQTIVSHVNQILGDRGYLAIEEVEKIFSELSSSCPTSEALEELIAKNKSGFIVDEKKISYLNNFFKICAGTQSLSQLLTSIAPKTDAGELIKQEISSNPSFQSAIHDFCKQTLKISCESLFKRAIEAYLAEEIEQGHATPNIERILALSTKVEERIESGGYFFSMSQDLSASSAINPDEGRSSTSSRSSDDQTLKSLAATHQEPLEMAAPKVIEAKTFGSRAGARSALGTLTNSVSLTSPSPIAYKPKALPAKLKRGEAANVEEELSEDSREAKAPKLAQRF